MNNTQKFIVTCRFPSWGNGAYPAFGIKYLVQIPIEIDEVETFFKEKYKEKINLGKKDFDGEILFVEETELVIL